MRCVCHPNWHKIILKSISSGENIDDVSEVQFAFEELKKSIGENKSN